MRLALLSLAVVMVCGIPDKLDDEEQVMVPSDVLRFILGCQKDAFGDPNSPLPVYHTDINTNTGTTSQKVTLLDTDQLRESLRDSVHSEEVLDLIIGQLSAAVHGVKNSNNRLRHNSFHRDSNSTSDVDSDSDSDSTQGCTVNNNIEISVPAQEVDNFNDRVQLLIQQNSLLLLEQINTLFTYKLRSLREDFANIVQQRNKKMNRKLDAILKALDVAAPIDADDEEEEPSPVGETITENSSEVEISTEAPTEVVNESEEDDTTDTPSEDTSDDKEDDVDGTRTASRPVPIRRRPAYRPRYPGSRPIPTKIDSTAEAPRPTQTRYASAVGARPARTEEDTNRLRQRQLQRQSFMSRRRKGPVNEEEKEEEQ